MTANHRLALSAFLASHGGKSLLWGAGDAFALYVMIVLLRLPPRDAGALFLAGSVWNAILDAAWGAALARSPQLQRWTPRIAIAAAAIACLSFAGLPWLQPCSLASAASLFLVFRTAFALFDVPHNAISATLAERHGHLRVMRLRTIGSALAGLLVAAAAIPLLAAGTTTLPALSMTAICAVAFVLLAPLPRLLALSRAPRKSAPQAVTHPEAIEAARTGPILVFCMIHMTGIGMLAAIGKITLHLGGEHAAILTLAPLALAATRLCSIPLWSIIARRLGISATLFLAYAASAAGILALPPALSSGPIPMAAAFLVLGTAIGGVVLLIWSAFSQLLERLDGAAAPGRAALQYGLFTATMKIALGGSAYLAGVWLAAAMDHPGPPHSAPFGLAGAIAAIAVMCGAGEQLRASTARRPRDRSSSPGGARAAAGFPA